MNGLFGKFRTRRSKIPGQTSSRPGSSCSDSIVPDSPAADETRPTFALNGTEPSEDLGQPSSSAHRVIRRTFIACTLSETLRDSSALSYFIQFMETIGQLNLIKFWLHVESFKASSLGVTRSDEALLTMMKNDAGNIFSKYICADAPCSIGITDKLRKEVIDRICTKDGLIDAHCLDDAQLFVRNIMENRYFKEFLSSIYYCKHQLDVFSSGSLSISDILRSQRLLCSFVEYLESEGDRKLIEFLIASETFAQQIGSVQNNTQAVDDAIIIYDKYFSMQATDPLKFGAKLRIQIESDICTETGRPSPLCFEGARRLAISILEQTYLKRFLASPPFMKFLYELMAQVDSNVELPNPHRKKYFTSSSDQSSEISLPSTLFEKKPRVRSLSQFGSQSGSALLPMGSQEEDETASQADSVSSYGNGYTPRQRHNRTNGISLATVDDLGRYRPLYDNTFTSGDEDGFTRRKIKNTLERYLHQSLTKEAEVADQVAQLIVADIHNMVSAGNSPRLPR